MKKYFSIPSIAFVVLVLSGILSLSLVFRTTVASKQIPTETSWVDAELAKMSLEQKIGQFFMVAAHPNKGEAHFNELDALVTEHHIGGMIFFQGERVNMKTIPK